MFRKTAHWPAEPKVCRWARLSRQALKERNTITGIVFASQHSLILHNHALLDPRHTHVLSFTFHIRFKSIIQTLHRLYNHRAPNHRYYCFLRKLIQNSSKFNIPPSPCRKDLRRTTAHKASPTHQPITLDDDDIERVCATLCPRFEMDNSKQRARGSVQNLQVPYGRRSKQVRLWRPLQIHPLRAAAQAETCREQRAAGTSTPDSQRNQTAEPDVDGHPLHAATISTHVCASRT